MLYLNNKQWDKTEWMKELAKFFNINKPGKRKDFVFELTDRHRGTKKVDGKWVPTYPESLNYPMSYYVNRDGEDVEVRYAQSPSIQKPMKGGTTVTEHDHDKIIFNNGVFKIKSTDLDLYFFMLMCPANETNPNYYKKVSGRLERDPEKFPTTVNFFFKERNEELNQADAYDNQKVKIEAQNYVINMMSEPEARELYKLENQSDWAEAPLKRIKNFLLVKAGENPVEFMASVNSEIRTVKSKVNEAVSAGLIHFDNRRGWWVWTGEGGGKIIQVARGQDSILALVKYLNEKDDGSVMAALEGKVIEAERDVLEEKPAAPKKPAPAKPAKKKVSKVVKKKAEPVTEAGTEA